MSDMMPAEDYNFIKGIQQFMLDSTNETVDGAYEFAFMVWQHKEWLSKYLLNDARNDIAYEQGMADAVDEFANELIKPSNYERFDFDDCLDSSDKANDFFKYVFSIAEQLKEQK